MGHRRAGTITPYGASDVALTVEILADKCLVKIAASPFGLCERCSRACQISVAGRALPPSLTNPPKAVLFLCWPAGPQVLWRGP